MTLRRLFAPILATLLPSAAIAGDVLIVSASGNGDHLTVEGAYAAASEGDTIYVLDLPFAAQALFFDGKGVTLVDGSATWVARGITVRNLPATSTFTLRGVSMWALGWVTIEDCQGPVLVSDLTFGIDGSALGLDIQRSDAVVVRRSDLRFGGWFREGLVIVDSTVLLEDCNAQGRNGWPGDPGGFCATCCTDGGPGGVGLVVRGQSTVRLQGGVVGGGFGGSAGGSFCNHGADAERWEIEPTAEVTFLDVTLGLGLPGIGTPTILNDPPRSFDLPVSIDAGASFQATMHGVQGDTGFVLAGGSTVLLPLSTSVGMLQVLGSPGRRRLGSLDGTGTRTFTFVAPAVAAGEVVSLPLQMVFVDPSGGVRLAPAGLVDVRGAGVPAW